MKNPAMHKEPLFRKENNTVHRNHPRLSGGEYRHKRNTKAEERSEATHRSMHGKKHRGLDYTPLFKFLLSSVGENWNEIYSEAVSRLDCPEPIFWLVALYEHERKEYVQIGETSFFSGLYVDGKGLLQRVNPDLGPERMMPLCHCCTYTLNGKPFSGRPSSETMARGVIKS
jgi:hypothetical protein